MGGAGQRGMGQAGFASGPCSNTPGARKDTLGTLSHQAALYLRVLWVPYGLQHASALEGTLGTLRALTRLVNYKGTLGTLRALME